MPRNINTMLILKTFSLSIPRITYLNECSRWSKCVRWLDIRTKGDMEKKMD